MSDKSNIQHLRDILKKIQDDKLGEATRNELFTEADEFVDALEQEQKDAYSKEEDLEEKLDAANEDGLLDYKIEEVGLDTFYWQLHNGNLAIQQEVESFVNRLRKKYIGVSA